MTSYYLLALTSVQFSFLVSVVSAGKNGHAVSNLLFLQRIKIYSAFVIIFLEILRFDESVLEFCLNDKRWLSNIL